jgi:PKD repeat protein
VDDIPPAAIFRPDRDSIKVGSSVRFDASATTDLDDPVSALSYRWDFGDGRTGQGPVAEHTYSRAGSYSVTLTVNDGAGGQTSKSIVIVVHEAALTGIDWRWPVAAVSASALAAAAIIGLVWRTARRPARPPRVIKRRLREGG